MPATVFVTVGTTKFDALVQAVDSVAVADALVAKGYSKLVIQKGAGKYQVQTLVPQGSQYHQFDNGLQVQVFEFAPSLAKHMQAADLIISHAGSGSIFEALKLGKPLIAVPNAILMDNHQSELAEHLARLHYLIAASPDTLAYTLQHLSTENLRPYEGGNAKGIIQHINAVVSKPYSNHQPIFIVSVFLTIVMFVLTWVVVRLASWPSAAGASDPV